MPLKDNHNWNKTLKGIEFEQIEVGQIDVLHTYISGASKSTWCTSDVSKWILQHRRRMRIRNGSAVEKAIPQRRISLQGYI